MGLFGRGIVYSLSYPLTASTVPTEYEQINGGANGSPSAPKQA